MSDTFSKIGVITGVARRRRFSTELMLAVVARRCSPACRSAMLPAATAYHPARYAAGGN
jgi:hypothetical protein